MQLCGHKAVWRGSAGHSLLQDDTCLRAGPHHQSVRLKCVRMEAADTDVHSPNSTQPRIVRSAGSSLMFTRQELFNHKL